MSPLLSLGSILLLACCVSTRAEMHTVTCEHQQGPLTCGRSLIKVISANYGRTDGHTCIAGRPASQISKTDCINTKTLPLVVNECEGKTSCSLAASNYVFTDPCYGTYKYLNVTYTCILKEPTFNLSEGTVICEGQQGVLSCGRSLIKVISANYGRTDGHTCIAGRPASQISKTDCINTKTLPLVVNECEGKTHCSLTASNYVFSDPCYGTYKYLDVAYACIPQ